MSLSRVHNTIFQRASPACSRLFSSQKIFFSDVAHKNKTSFVCLTDCSVRPAFSGADLTQPKFQLRNYGTQKKPLFNNPQEDLAEDPLQEYLPNRLKSSGLSSVFEPASVAVVGATDRLGAVGRTIVNNLILGNKNAGNQYKIFPVNPTRETCLGLKCYPSVGAIPEDVEMVVFVTPAKSCLNVMKECAAKGVKAAVVISAGFKEAGPAGIKLEQDLIKTARDAGIRVIGPNCVGVMNPKFGLNATFASVMGLPGNVAFISQSGAMCTSVLDWSLREKIGFSAFVSVGSMADVNWGDLIDYLGSDKNTESILIYMESVGDAASFLSAAKEVSMTKPIVVIKAGKSEAAAAAAASHTGSLAGSYKSFEAAMNRVGVLTVDTIQELFNFALVLGKQPRPQGPNLMILTNAGGPAVLATDAAVTSGAKIAKLEKSTYDKLDKILPPSWSRSNPVDILGDAPAELFAESLEIVLEDKNADGILVVLSPQDVTEPTLTAQMLVDARQRLLEKHGGKLTKPILAAWMGGNSVVEGFRLLNAHDIPAFSNPDEAASTFGKVWSRTEALQSLYDLPQFDTAGPVSVPAEKKNHCIEIFQTARKEGRNLLTESESKKVLAAYGIPTVQTIVAVTADEAEAAAKDIGAKLFAVKLNSKTLTHKADVGGVKLNIPGADVKAAFNAIRDSVKSLHGLEHFEGVTVQPMVQLDKGIELILGSTVDGQFGPLVLFGSGGTMVEIFKDTALGVPPLDENLAKKLMGQTKIYKALKGAQGKRFEGVDLAQLEGVMSRFSQMVVDLSEYVAECDINPLLAMKSDFLALDARIALTKKDSLPVKLAVRPYPYEYVTKGVEIDGGATVTIRPIYSSDHPKLVEFHKSLSKETVRLRFLEDIELEDRITHEKMVSVCFADYDRGITLVAVDEKSGAIIGVTRLDRSPPNHLYRDEAFIQIIVADDFQGHGLGGKFMDHVQMIAQKEGIMKLKAAVSKDNTRYLKLSEERGWKNMEIEGEDTDIQMCMLQM